MVEVKDLCFKYGTEPILNNIRFTANSGEITAVIGTNGAGKSTLLKCIAGLLKSSGEIIVYDKNNNIILNKEHPKRIGYLGQDNRCDAELNVFEVILMGLVNELSFYVGKKEMNKVYEIMDIMSLTKYAGRKINQLSGGQQQLVFIAQTLIKHPDVLIMDEPTSALDLNKQFQLMDLIKDLTEKYQFTTMVCHHHLDLVSKYANKVLVLNNGQKYACSSPQNAFTEEMFRDVYGMRVELHKDQEGIQHMVPVNRI